jgi:hypothetical protein
MRKYYLLLIGMLLLAVGARAQVTLNLALNSRPQPWLSEWGNPVNGMMVIAFMHGPVVADPSVKIRTTLLNESGSVIGASNINAARPYILKQGINEYSMADALQLQNLRLPGTIQNLLQRTGRLPAGQYQLTVEVTNTKGDLVLAQQTRPFFITSYQLPILMRPADGDELDAHIAQSVITFKWTSLVPSTQEVPVYRIQVFEILPGQESMQAFRSNRPVLDEQAMQGSTQYIWRTNLPMLDSTANKRFIWTIQTLDMNGQPIPTADNNVQGRSEPAIFSIVNQMGAADKNRKKEEQIKQ